MRVNFTNFAIVCLLVGVCIIGALGQSRVNNTGTGGVHTVQGRIYLPNGRSPQSPMSVKLQSSVYSTLSVETDSNGGFSFRNLGPGNYAVVVEAVGEFDTARDYVMIDVDVKPQGMVMPTIPKIQTVFITLQFKRSVAGVAPDVINAKLAAAPKAAVKHYETGLKFVHENKNQEAVAEFQQAIRLYPEFSLAMIEAAKAHFKLGNLNEALKHFLSARQIEPKNFEANLGSGVVHLNKQEYGDAQKDLEQAREINPTAATARYYLGLVFLRSRRNPEAQTEFEEAKKLKGTKDLPLVHYYLGGIYWSAKQYAKAAEELNQYLQMEPNTKDADKLRQTIADLRSKPQ